MKYNNEDNMASKNARANEGAFSSNARRPRSNFGGEQRRFNGGGFRSRSPMQEGSERPRRPMARRLDGNKDALRSRKFNYTCFIKDDKNHYKQDKRYDGKIGEIKEYKPYNSTDRNRKTISTRGIYKGDPVKQLTVRLNGKDGRNNNGHITSGHTRTATRRLYRKIDFFRESPNDAVVLHIEKDPNRTSFIALVKDTDNRVFYIPATLNMKVGDTIQSGDKADCLPGNILELEKIDDGSEVSNIEMSPGNGSKVVRAAGTFGILVRKEAGYAFIRLPSGEERKFLLKCKAYVGKVSNQNHKHIRIGSAGKAFHMGRRPVNRPSARNPVDHHLGGRSMGKRKTNFQGNMVHGQRTRSPRKNNKLIYRSRHRAK